MYLLDNNVLISAFRPDLDHHGVSREWLEASLNGGRALRLFPTVEVGFVRIVTHPKIFNPPSPLAEASGFLQVLCEAPSVAIATWTSACRERWLTLCAELSLSGNDCNDAVLAAVALEKNLHLVTFDQGFQRFPNLRLELLAG